MTMKNPFQVSEAEIEQECAVYAKSYQSLTAFIQALTFKQALVFKVIN